MLLERVPYTRTDSQAENYYWLKTGASGGGAVEISFSSTKQNKVY